MNDPVSQPFWRDLHANLAVLADLHGLESLEYRTRVEYYRPIAAALDSLDAFGQAVTAVEDAIAASQDLQERRSGA